MKRIIGLSLILALLAGCARENGQEKVKSERIRVMMAPAVLVPGSGELSYSGTVEASQTIPLTFQSTGIVQEVFVEAGDEVKTGQVLARIDDTDIRNLYATALAKYNQAKDAYDRLKKVHDEGSLPDIKWVEMQTNLDQARASLDLAQNNLGKCRLTAPVDGMVGRRNIEPGQSSLSLVSAPIELVRIGTVLVKISVPENEINRIRKGQKARISAMALDGASVEGTVTNISPVAEVMSRTYTAKITVSNPGFGLKPGMVCDVQIDAGTGNTALVVPYQSVGRDEQGNNFVFLVTPDRTSVKKQVVTVGRYNGGGIEIKAGLSEGQMVVTGGIEKLSDNCQIEM